MCVKTIKEAINDQVMGEMESLENSFYNIVDKCY